MEFSSKRTRVGSQWVEDLPDPGIKTRSPALQAESLQFETPGKPQCCSWGRKELDTIRRLSNMFSSYLPYHSQYMLGILLFL